MEEPQSGIDLSDIDINGERSLQTAESLRLLREQADQTLGAHRQRVGEIEARLNEQLELITEELTRERLADEQTLADSAANSAQRTEVLEQLQQTLAEKEAEVEEVLDQLASQSLEFEALLAERDEELEQVLELGEEDSQQRESLTLEKESLEQQLATARQALENQQTEEHDETSQARNELAEVEQRLQQLDEQFRTQQEEQAAQQAELEETRQASDAAQGQSEQMQRKFELALADVHKFKRENAELHEELLSRPEADDQESPELVSLRTERDALAERIEELENVPAPTTSDDEQQALEDLQSRFEMAVDDVRQLKQEKATLQQKLEAAPTVAVTNSSEEPLDWQAQKALLMASLDAEDQGLVDETRQEERATVEGTITITDRVVAEKDAMLAEWEAEVVDLQSQLEARPEGQNLEALREQLTAEIFGDDEAVQVECEHLRQQQKLLDDKLREAELEISVQRATLAREQMALKERLAELPDADAGTEKSSGGKPRRRWLSALGLKDDGES